MNVADLKQLISNIKSSEHINNDSDFEKNSDFFINKKYDQQRKLLYTEIMSDLRLPSLAASKHHLLKNIFGDYISIKLNEARKLNLEYNDIEAKNIINQLSKFQNIFKDHDLINFQEFISQAEPNLSEFEATLLFLKPALSEDEIEDIQSAILKALGKKHITLDNKEEFQLKFFNHPLINCLTVYKNFDFVANQVQNDRFKFGDYEKLIKTLIKINSKELHEEYQGFISFLIKEDLTLGFSKILKNTKYNPKYLRDLLQKITTGAELDDDSIKKLIIEIKNNHTKNIKLNSKQELVQNISSTHSLNDYGFEFILNNNKLFLHGHETDNNGINQNNQQANTTLTLRNHNYDTIGMTVLTNNVTRDSENKRWINAEGFKGLLKLTQAEECLLTGLQFVSKYMLSISIPGKIDIRELKNGSILNSNHHIVKSDIKTSQELINFKIGKGDLELINEYKNAYMNIFEKNIDFFKVVLKTTSTDNQSQFQLIADPLLNFIKAVKRIENKTQINILTEHDTKVLNNIIDACLEGNFYNVHIGDLIVDASTALQSTKIYDNALNESNAFNALSTLICKGDERLISKCLDISKDAENAKIIHKIMDNNNLEAALQALEDHPLSNDCSKTSKTVIAKKLELLIDTKCENLLSMNYNKNRVERMASSIKHWNGGNSKWMNGITRTLLEGKNIYFNQSANGSSANSNQQVLAELLRDPKKENLILLKAFCCLADLKGAKINCSGLSLKSAISYNLSKNKI